jgi:hypothetical protein
MRHCLEDLRAFQAMSRNIPQIRPHVNGRMCRIHQSWATVMAPKPTRMSPRPKRISLDDIEIVGIVGSSTGGRRKPLTKSSRRQEVRREVVHLRHSPSGRETHIEIPSGHYAKGDMERMREEAKREFATALEREHF